MLDQNEKGSKRLGIIGAIVFPLLSFISIGLLIYFNYTTYDLCHLDGEYAWVASFVIFASISMIVLFSILSIIFACSGITFSLAMLKDPNLSYRISYTICIGIEILTFILVIANIISLFTLTLR